MVNLFLSSVFTPTTPFADSLLGGGNGIDYGTGVNGQWAPIVSKVANTGALNMYLSHDGTNEITQLKTFIQAFGTSTGYTYGGGDSAANDFTTLRNMGNTSGTSKNNADGLSAGVWCEMDADVNTTNQFDKASRPSQVFIFGQSLAGIDISTAYTVIADAMVYSNGGIETVGSAPQAGKIGASGNTTLGDRAHLRGRVFLPQAFSVGNYLQFEHAFIYAFTS